MIGIQIFAIIQYDIERLNHKSHWWLNEVWGNAVPTYGVLLSGGSLIWKRREIMEIWQSDVLRLSEKIGKTTILKATLQYKHVKKYSENNNIKKQIFTSIVLLDR